MKKSIIKVILAFIILTAVTALLRTDILAAPLDEIVDYEVNASVNQDATVDLKYHIEWKVLDSDKEGPLSWVRIGIPNSHYSNLQALTDNIRCIGYDSSGGSYVRIDFDRDYYSGEVIVFEFSVTMDHMYRVSSPESGYTEYVFTPAWFDDIAIDKMTVRWKADKAYSWDPYCLTLVGSLVWMEKDMAPGKQMTVKVTYPNDAYAFDTSRKTEEHESPLVEGIAMIFGLMIILVTMGAPFALIAAVIALTMKVAYRSRANFMASSGEKKITRTKIVYYDSCPSCGSVRGEDQKKCEYCGHSFIKSEEIIEEKTLADEDKKKYSTEGEFKFSDSPNTYMRVHVVPVMHSSRSSSFASSIFGSSSSSRGASSHSSSSHHSSCAHSSCACACACACAGGGRAGCSNKDFYKTGLKLKWLKLC